LERNEAAIERMIDDLTQTIQVAVFKIKLSKVKPKKNGDHQFRLVALPMSEKYERWTKRLYEHFRKAGNNYVFPFNRAVAFYGVQGLRLFKGLQYPIKGYSYYKKDGAEPFNVMDHLRTIKMDGLRAVRVDELREKYHFDDLDLAAFTGSKISIRRLRGVYEGSTVTEDWHRYIKKLCVA
jgi:hypothetical protein